MTTGTGPHPADEVIWNPVERNWHLRVPWRRRLAAAHSPAAPSCPFCAGGSEALSDDTPHTVSSKYPFITAPSDASYDPHRVLFFSRRHDRNLADLSTDELAAVLDRVSQECSALLEADAVRSVYAFQAFGPLFGGSVSHPHLQVLGFPFVPSKLVLDSDSGCVLCWSLGDEECVVSSTDDFTLQVPPWSRLPFEMVLTPREHVHSLDQCDTRQVAELLSRGLRAVDALLPAGDTPYTVNVMTAPVATPRGDEPALDSRHHFRLEIFPFCTEEGRVRQIIAIEAGAGLVLNPLLPPDAAARLRATTHSTTKERP